VEGALVGAEVPPNLGSGDGDVAHLVGVNVTQELREIDILLVAAHHIVLLEKLPEHQQAGNDEHPEQDLFDCRIHLEGNLSCQRASPASREERIARDGSRPGQLDATPRSAASADGLEKREKT